MSRTRFRPLHTGAAVLSAVACAAVLASTTAPAVAAPDCLAAPDDTPTEGRRWYYRLDHANNRKCWYLRAPGEARAASPAGGEASDSGPASVSATPVPATPLPPGAAATPAEPLAGAPVAAATGRGVDGRGAPEHPSHPLTDAEREALFREFLAWRLQQPAD
ncbi:hypothetical protein PQJ75_27230 [Rhodoplanes sp. TEM]|uniref:Secreted protein n=1 Tax=Rhodoplanes tepidamans TaxID=200616 RepID=A0ABT5J774_RHOTP|nr:MULTISPECIES: hypothetical protein [Rhodoplanes]MDC7785456.1 hypothetical protein [Rhodoplanes tepidamans]MDC7987443.1 hypothetical protein [Rhodoplanes sp. TEM]MDQ0353374.1 hypothetical protein [Rhodoplanes tepidamans]